MFRKQNRKIALWKCVEIFDSLGINDFIVLKNLKITFMSFKKFK
jgi:hypothetical protein